MANFFKKLLGNEKCFICNRKAEQPKYYFNDTGDKVAVCYKCVEYAERRAMLRAK